MRKLYAGLTDKELERVRNGVQWELEHSFNEPDYKVEQIENEMKMIKEELKRRNK